MHHFDHRLCAAVLATMLVAGCAGASTVTGEPGIKTVLPPTALRAATGSLSTCSVTAKAQGVSDGQILQAGAVSAKDMWFDEFMYPDDTLDVARYSPGGPPQRVLQPFSGMPVYYAYLKVFADNDIWVAANPQSASDYAIAHWNGSSWREITLVGMGTPYFAPRGLSGLSSNDLWMSGDAIIGGNSVAAIAHWNGKTFSVIGSLPVTTASGAGPVLELSPTNVWTIAGVGGTGVLAAQWDGSGFASYMLPSPPGESNANTAPVQIAATGPGNIWIIGQQEMGSTTDGRVWHYDGSWEIYSYAPRATDDSTIFQGVAPLDATRAVITAEDRYRDLDTATYSYSGAGSFHSIPNNLTDSATGPDELVPGTSDFWMPTAQRPSGGDVLDLVSCE